MDDDKSLINVDAKASLVNVDLGDSIEIKADFTDLINNATPRGISWVARLLGGRKSADTERYIRLLKAQTDVDVKGISEGKSVFDPKEGTLLPTSQGLKQQIVNAIKDEEILNLIACSIKAAENIKEGETEKEPSQDFINRWRNDAKQIYSEELQNIWGRLMAEEINNPDSVSLRTLDVIKNISKDEAKAFIALLKYIMRAESYKEVYGIQVYSGWEHLKKNDILLSDAAVFVSLNKLKESGLLLDINFDYKNSFTMCDRKICNRYAFYLETINYNFYIPHHDIHILPSIYFLRLTRAAEDIYKILCTDKNNRRPQRQDAIDFIEVIRRELISCGAWHIYFGYKEDNGLVAEYEKYPLL